MLFHFKVFSPLSPLSLPFLTLSLTALLPPPPRSPRRVCFTFIGLLSFTYIDICLFFIVLTRLQPPKFDSLQSLRMSRYCSTEHKVAHEPWASSQFCVKLSHIFTYTCIPTHSNTHTHTHMHIQLYYFLFFTSLLLCSRFFSFLSI